MSGLSQLHKQAQALLNQGKYQDAHQCCLQILQQKPDFADAYFLLAMIAFAFSNTRKAIEVIHRALIYAPNNAEYLAHLAKCYAFEYDVVNAKKYADLACEEVGLSGLTLDTLGVTYSKIGLHLLAVPCFEQAVKLYPERLPFQFNLAAAYKFIGCFAQAEWHYLKVLELDPDYYKAEYALAMIRCQSSQNINCDHRADRSNVALTESNSASITRLTKQLSDCKAAENQLFIAHSLALYLEKEGQKEQAFKALMQGKQAKLAQINYSIDTDQALFQQLTTCAFEQAKNVEPLKNQNQNQNQNTAYKNGKPIFVVGLPRSGTTLVERILSNHSQVHSAGELQQFGWLFKKMSGSCTPDLLDLDTLSHARSIDYAALGQAYIEHTQIYAQQGHYYIDKMPLNILYAAHILKALPDVQIVCLMRNPLDTIVGNFRQLFAVNFSYYNYAYDLTSLAHYYVEFYKLAHHWQTLFPQQFKIVNYEALVQSPKAQIEALLQSCQLEWEDNCLHIEMNNSPVATPSAMQVKQPINTASIGRWRAYDAFLQPVKHILQQANIPF